MGQVSLPVLNRTGYSTFWHSVWNSNHNYNRNLKEDFLLKNILPAFFNERFSFKKQFLSFNFFDNITVLDSTNFWTVFKNNSKLYIDYINMASKNISKLVYLINVWILKFQTWVIIFFILYKPVKGVLDINASKLPSNTDLSSFLGFYRCSIVYSKFNKFFLRNNKFKKVF